MVAAVLPTEQLLWEQTVQALSVALLPVCMAAEGRAGDETFAYLI